MDREQFDSLARFVFTQQSRRTAIATIVSAAVLGRAPASLLAKGKSKAQAKATVKSCYPSTNCTPGKGKNTSGCDFSGSTAFFEGDFRGANLSNSNFTGAQLAHGDFRGANLSGACLVSANLLDAKLGASVNLDKAVLCHTLMPDGSIEERDCGKGTRCCPAPPAVCREECGPDDCISTIAQPCCTLGFCTPCCTGGACTPTLPNFLVSTCEWPCTIDLECRNRFGADFKCVFDPILCPFIGSCCHQVGS